MKPLKYIIPDELYNKGICLRDRLQINEIIWDYKYSIEFINVIEKQNLIILGGDVYYTKNGKVQPTCDSWFFEQTDNPNSVKMSVEKARNYITFYNNRNGNDYWYSFVISEAYRVF